MNPLRTNSKASMTKLITRGIKQPISTTLIKDLNNKTILKISPTSHAFKSPTVKARKATVVRPLTMLLRTPNIKMNTTTTNIIIRLKETDKMKVATNIPFSQMKFTLTINKRRLIPRRMINQITTKKTTNLKSLQSQTTLNINRKTPKLLRQNNSANFKRQTQQFRSPNNTLLNMTSTSHGSPVEETFWATPIITMTMNLMSKNLPRMLRMQRNTSTNQSPKIPITIRRGYRTMTNQIKTKTTQLTQKTIRNIQNRLLKTTLNRPNRPITIRLLTRINIKPPTTTVRNTNNLTINNLTNKRNLKIRLLNRLRQRSLQKIRELFIIRIKMGTTILKMNSSTLTLLSNSQTNQHSKYCNA